MVTDREKERGNVKSMRENTESMVDFEETPTVGTTTAHLLAVVLRTTLSLTSILNSLRAFSQPTDTPIRSQ